MKRTLATKIVMASSAAALALGAAACEVEEGNGGDPLMEENDLLDDGGDL